MTAAVIALVASLIPAQANREEYPHRWAVVGNELFCLDRKPDWSTSFRRLDMSTGDSSRFDTPGGGLQQRTTYAWAATKERLWCLMTHKDWDGTYSATNIDTLVTPTLNLKSPPAQARVEMTPQFFAALVQAAEGGKPARVFAAFLPKSGLKGDLLVLADLPFPELEKGGHPKISGISDRKRSWNISVHGLAGEPVDDPWGSIPRDSWKHKASMPCPFGLPFQAARCGESVMLVTKEGAYGLFSSGKDSRIELIAKVGQGERSVGLLELSESGRALWITAGNDSLSASELNGKAFEKPASVKTEEGDIEQGVLQLARKIVSSTKTSK